KARRARIARTCGQRVRPFRIERAHPDDCAGGRKLQGLRERDRMLRELAPVAQSVQSRRTPRPLAVAPKAAPPQIRADEAKAMKWNSDPAVDAPSGRPPGHLARRRHVVADRLADWLAERLSRLLPVGYVAGLRRAHPLLRV